MCLGICFFTLLAVCLGSEVLDEYNQKAIIVSDYCPTVPGCQDGTHVMCLHYDPQKEMGPGCEHPENVTMTSEFSQLILDICNRIRSKVANGLGKGEDSVDLPRAYGMYKLSWDPELATLAQIWANQCILTTDLCRSTRRFPTVGQIVGMSRYTIKDWKPISENNEYKFPSNTLTPDKVKYAVTYILKAWYDTKDDVIPDVIDYYDMRTYSKHNQFLQLVSGPSTHMGCGLSAYREYAYNDNNAALNYNSILLVCNFSHQPRVEDPVYITKAPTEPGYTVKCGCPLGYDEDEDCLCYETDRGQSYTCKNTGRCKPSVVVLPIFTVEDAPLNTLGQNNTDNVIEINLDNINKGDIGKKRMSHKDYTRSHRILKQKQDSKIKTRRISTDVRKRYFTGKNARKTTKPTQEHNKRHNPKQSVFAKAAVFELPSSKSKLNRRNHINFKQDVVPRRDFSKVHTLVSKYLEGRRMKNALPQIQENLNKTIIESTTHPSNNITITTTSYSLNRFSKQKFTYIDLNSTKTPKNADIRPMNEETDQILMDLLDKLEEEVNNIQINTKEKEIFDEKIRKIYGTLLKKPVQVEQENLIVNRNVSLDNNMVDDMLVEKDLMGRNLYSDHNKANAYTYPQVGEIPVNEKSFKNQHSYTNDDRDSQYKQTDKFSYRTKPLVSLDMDERELSNMYLKRKSHLNSATKGKRHENYYLKSDLEDYNSLDSDRRQHYFDKLSNLQRKISLMKKHERQNFIPEDRHLRPVRPSKHGKLRHSRPKEMDVYMPDRARFLHGF